VEVQDTDEARVEDMPLPADGGGCLPIAEAPGGVELGLDGDASNLGMQVAAGLEGIKKRHVCPQCGKGYASAGHLKQHVESVHEGKKPHVCPQCGDAFAQAGQLNSHVVVVHEGAKPFVCEKCQHPFAAAYLLERHLPSCGRFTSSQRAAISSNGCYAFREREISEADRAAEQLVASAVGGEVPVLHRDASAEQKNDWNAQVDAKVLQMDEATEGGPLAVYIGSTHAEGLLIDLLIDPETRSFPADGACLVECLTRRGSDGALHYTSRTEKGEWVFAAREYPPPGAGHPVPALIPIAISFDPISNTAVAEGRLVKLGHKGQGHPFINPANFNAGDLRKMVKFGSVLYVLPTTGVVGRAEVDELLGKQRVETNERRATKRQQKQSSEDELSHSSTLEGDSQG